MKKTFLLLTALLCVLLMSFCSLAAVMPTALNEVGLVVNVPDDYAELRVSLAPYTDNASGMLILEFDYYDFAALEPVITSLQQAAAANDRDAFNLAVADYQAALQKYACPVAAVVGIPDALVPQLEQTLSADSRYAMFGKNCGYTYYTCAYECDASLYEGFEAADNAIRDMLVSLSFCDVVKPQTGLTAEAAADGLASFSTVDTEGNAVTEELFSKADVTVINIWQTTCGPCINEMPELAAWAKELPENVQLVGLVCDVSALEGDNFSTCKLILEKSGVEFPTLIMNESLNRLLMNVEGTPTTLFIGRDGSSVHEPILGAYVERYKAAVEEILSK